MEEPEIVSPKGRPAKGGSWMQAYMMFLKNPSESRALKMMPLVLLGLVPVTVLDDLVLPGIGLIDNVPTSLVVIVVGVLTWLRVKSYRNG